MSIKVPNPMWETPTIRSKDAVVRADAAIELKAGHPLFEQEDGSYKAYPLTQDLAESGEGGVPVVTGRVVILGDEHDITESDLATGIKARVIFMGNVYVEALRSAGVTAEKATDQFIMGLSADRTAINFIDYENKEVWE